MGVLPSRYACQALGRDDVNGAILQRVFNHRVQKVVQSSAVGNDESGVAYRNAVVGCGLEGVHVGARRYHGGDNRAGAGYILSQIS